MTPQAALIELLARVGARNGAAVLVSAEELSEWPAAAVAAMKSLRIATKTRNRSHGPALPTPLSSSTAEPKKFSPKK